MSTAGPPACCWCDIGSPSPTSRHSTPSSSRRASRACRCCVRLGIAAPIYPVKGFSATMDLLPGVRAPAQALMDEAYKTAITPLGRRLRIAGTAEVSGHRLRLRQAALKTLRKVATDWFGDNFDLGTARYWVGAQADDAGRAAAARPHPPRRPVRQHRPWFHRLGDELRIRPRHGGPGGGTATGIDLDGLTLARLAQTMTAAACPARTA